MVLVCLITLQTRNLTRLKTECAGNELEGGGVVQVRGQFSQMSYMCSQVGNNKVVLFCEFFVYMFETSCTSLMIDFDFYAHSLLLSNLS